MFDENNPAESPVENERDENLWRISVGLYSVHLESALSKLAQN